MHYWQQLYQRQGKREIKNKINILSNLEVTKIVRKKKKRRKK